ncbi:MAG: bacteriohemerythrin [Pseudomonadota bacterium]|nr:bacteriohemerythrin [Pseudomonadota bacterium]
MAILHWVPELDTGIAEVDVQHRRIVHYINKLHGLRQTHERAALGEVIAELVDYTISHFAFEEALMESAGYIFSVPHKKVHDLFTRKVAQLQARFDAGEDVTEELHSMLSRWLFNHIRNEDHGYVEAVRAYQRLVEQERGVVKDRVRAEVRHELAQAQRQKSWLARLLGR